MMSSPVAPARRTRATSSSTKRTAPRVGVGRPLAQADMEHLAGVGSRGEEGVIAEHVGVAIARPTLGLAAHLADGRVEVDDHLGRPGPRAERPGSSQRLGEHGVELADVAEGEGAQERPERRRRHHPVRRAPPPSPPSAARRRGRCAMPPATMACTKVSTLRPGSAPPTRPERPTVALTRLSRSRRATSVATNNKPALATRLGSSKVTPIRSILRDTDLTESASWCWVNRVFEQHKFSQAGRHFPRMREPLRGYVIGGSRLISSCSW